MKVGKFSLAGWVLSVLGLGNFLELEVVLQEGQRAEDGTAIATALLEKLGVKKKDLITSAYIDLIKKRY